MKTLIVVPFLVAGLFTAAEVQSNNPASGDNSISESWSPDPMSWRMDGLIHAPALTGSHESAGHYSANESVNDAKSRAFSHMREKGIYVRDAAVLTILLEGLEKTPGDALLLAEIALAYYDLDDTDNAYEFARKAQGLSENTPARFFTGLENLNNALTQYWTDRNNNAVRQGHSYFRNSVLDFQEAERTTGMPHPLISYYFAYAQWHFSSIDAPGRWASDVGFIRNRFESAIRFGRGTKYDSFAVEAQTHLNSLR